MNTNVTRRSVAVALLALSLTAATVPSGKPEDVGLSSERLLRVNDVVKTYIDSGQISGAVTMVSRKGRIAHFEAQGLMDIEGKTPMRKDAIFRMASMSKPVAGVAILLWASCLDDMFGRQFAEVIGMRSLTYEKASSSRSR